MSLSCFSFLSLSFFLFLSLFLSPISSVPYDLINNRYMDFNWLEFGQTTAVAFDSFAGWTTVTTTSMIPTGVGGNVVAFLSIPDVDLILPDVGGLITALPPLVPKMNGRPTRNSDGTYSFQFKLIHPNDSQCSKEWYSKQWYTPSAIDLRIPMTWLVAVEGAYSILTNYTSPFFNTNFIISSGTMTRASSSPTATSTNGNAIQLVYPTGCDHKPTETCYVTENCGAIQQLQTSSNTVDNGLDLFLSVRAWSIRQRSSWFVLVPHDSYSTSYFVLSIPETVGYIIFPTDQTITCIEGFAFQTKTYTDVTSFPILFPFNKNYTGPPGVFGMIGTVNSMVDSTSLSVYDVHSQSSTIITKEDQCTTEQTIHTTPEVIHVLIVGRTVDSPWLQCYAIYNTEPTPAPTHQPTHTCMTLEVIK